MSTIAEFQPLTKRETLIARQAYAQRARDDYNDTGWQMYEDDVRARAARHYPLPKVTRPRVVRESGDFLREYRVVDGRLEYRSRDIHKWTEVRWSGNSNWTVTPERARIWADLFANPDEEVEE